MARTLVTGGTVVSMDHALGVLAGGDVLIEDGVIVEVGASIEVGECAVIDASGMVVMPGLVDSHRHLWYSALQGAGMDHTLGEFSTRSPVFDIAKRLSPDDVYATTRAGIVYALENGVTTMLHEPQRLDTPDHEAEVLRAHRELPARAVLALTPAFETRPSESSSIVTGSDWARPRRLRAELTADDGLLTMAIALPDPAWLGAERTQIEILSARELGLPMHVNGGFPMGEPSGGMVRILAERALIGADMNFVHCNTTDENEYRMMLDAGAVTATSCPMTEILVGLGLPALGRMNASGIAAAIGTDALCAATGDMLENARTGLILARAHAETDIYAQGRAPETVDDLGMTTLEALEAVTINGARACHLGARTGSLTPGKAADLILLRADALGLSPLNDPIPTIVSRANGSDIDTVIVAGETVKRDGSLVGINAAAIRAALATMQERLYQAAESRVRRDRTCGPADL